MSKKKNTETIEAASASPEKPLRAKSGTPSVTAKAKSSVGTKVEESAKAAKTAEKKSVKPESPSGEKKATSAKVAKSAPKTVAVDESKAVAAKTSAPAKSKAASANGSAAKGGSSIPAITHDEIARLAYSYAEARGFQGGSPELDWSRAEQELRRLRGL